MIFKKTITVFAAVMSVVSLFPNMSLAANVSRDLDFQTGAGFDDIVLVLVLQPDGKILVGGHFNEYDGESANYLARLNVDGSRDGSFDVGTGFNGSIRTIALQDDGKVVVGGQFNNYNGSTTVSDRITRLNSDGTVDTSFLAPATGFNQNVEAIAIQSDGKILVGGTFTAYGTSTVGSIARLNSDGTLDETFVTGGGFDNKVGTLTLQDDGKILAGGLFTQYASSSANRIVRLNSDGSRDGSFDMGTGFDAAVEAFEIQPDGKILVGGPFDLFNGQSVDRLVRLGADGTLDSGFNAALTINNLVYDIVLQPDGKILVGGGFAPAYLTRLNSDGSLNQVFPDASTIHSVVLQPDGKLIAGGSFTTYGGQPASRIVRVTSIPSLVSAQVDADSVSLVFDEPLDETSVPSSDAFVVATKEVLYSNDFSDGVPLDVEVIPGWSDGTLGSVAVTDGVLVLSDFASDRYLYPTIDLGQPEGFFPEGSTIRMRVRVNSNDFDPPLYVFTGEWDGEDVTVTTEGEWVDVELTETVAFNKISMELSVGDELSAGDSIEIDSLSILSPVAEPVPVLDVLISGTTVTLSLDSPVASTTGVTLSYTVPGESFLRGIDPIGAVSSIVDQSVVNVTTDPDPEPEPQQGGGNAGGNTPAPRPSSSGSGRGGSFVQTPVSAESSVLVSFLVSQYREVLATLLAAGFQLPADVVAALRSIQPSVVSTPVSLSKGRDMTIGTRGADVSSLQAFLSARDSGPAAKALVEVGSTGYFGLLTRAALAEWQESVGITPATGYFGSLTRTHLEKSGF